MKDAWGVEGTRLQMLSLESRLNQAHNHVTDLLIATRPDPTGSTKTLVPQEVQRPQSHRKYKDPGLTGSTKTLVPQVVQRPQSHRKYKDPGPTGSTKTLVLQEVQRPWSHRKYKDPGPKETLLVKLTLDY